MTEYRLGVDIGGTFTDIILLGSDGSLFSRKVLSTPDDYSLAIEEGVRVLLGEVGITASSVCEFVHGSTIATNAIIERRGVRVALLTTKGFRDVLEMGRFRAPRLYDLSFRKPEPLVERRLRFEVDERTDAQGKVLRPVEQAELDRVAEWLAEEDIKAVAICFINAYVNPDNETMAARHLSERLQGISISTSTQLLPQIQEYERTSTTVINSYIRPVVEGYVNALADRMRRLGIRVPLMIMQSSGGILPATLVAKNPVYLIESGPAAGVVGAQRIGQRQGLADLMVLDMGGTTAKAAIIEDGRFSILPEGEVGGGVVMGTRLVQGAGYAVQVPTIDIVEVGAGGGSIVSVDVAGGIQVGPRSAGADPGPVCYDRGGTQPTVTDANLTLGYLNPEALVGGDLKLNFEKAERTLAALGERIGQPLTDTAYGIHRLVNANMMRAMRGVSIERGSDPTRFTLMAMGGNGGVHAASLAEAFEIRRVLVPPVAGLFSALGLLFADVEHSLIRAFYRRLDATAPDALNAVLRPLVEEAHALLLSEGFSEAHQREIEIVAEMKYFGQGSTLSVPLPTSPMTREGLVAVGHAFEEIYRRTFGHVAEGEPQQFVTFKVIARGLGGKPRLPERLTRSREVVAERSERRAYFGPRFGWMRTPVVPRRALFETSAAGPLIVEEYDTTTVVRPGWRAHLDDWNNIILEGQEGQSMNRRGRAQ
ncbi:MAG: hydantoinase/oxoprolinase family protein [Nitrospinota bacterium]